MKVRSPFGKGGGRRGKDGVNINVLCTGFDDKSTQDDMKRMIESLSGHYISSSDSKWHDKVTHIVVPTNYNGYTSKVFYGISRCVQIVTQTWLNDSANKSKFLPPSMYAPRYVKKALENASHAADHGGILGGYSLYFVPGVAGTGLGKMSMSEWSIIINAAGGERLTSQQRALDRHDATKVLVVTGQIKMTKKTARFVEDAKTNGSLVVPSTNLHNVFRHQAIEALLVKNWSPAANQDGPTKPGCEYIATQTSPMAPEDGAVETTTQPQPTSNETEPKETHTSPVLVRLDFETLAKKATDTDEFDEFITPLDKPYKITLEGPMFVIPVQRSPQRTTSKMNVLKDLGEDGTLSVFKCTSTGLMFIRYYDKDGVLVLDAQLDLDDVHYVLKGRAGEDNHFYLDALNSAHSNGGTTILHAPTPGKSTGLRRFLFWFDTPADLAITLYWMFDKNRDLVNEFYEMDGKMTSFKQTKPPHFIDATDDDMITEDDDALPCFPPTAGFIFEEDEGYNPGGQSQPLF